ncbi:hypothetical protein EP7_005559 (plasmid) [Isosphaeraceae bacterium EP7]
MRAFLFALAGSLIGGSCGLACFLALLSGQGALPDNGDGGVATLIILGVIAAGFAASGGLVGCLAGLLIGLFTAGREDSHAGPPFRLPEEGKKPPPRGIWDEYFDS